MGNEAIASGALEAGTTFYSGFSLPYRRETFPQDLKAIRETAETLSKFQED